MYYWDSSIHLDEYEHNKIVDEDWETVVKNITEKYPKLWIMISPGGYGGSEGYYDRMVAVDTKRFMQR